MDFNGTTPGTVAVTSSSVGLRLHHGFAEAQYGETFFVAAGQAFTLMTAAKDQLSIWPSDVELSQAVDTNYLAGMIWSRTPQLRVTWRPSTRINWAVSVENPEQQLGKGLVTLPDCCASDIDAQYNTGDDELKAPDLMPDFVTRVAINAAKSLHVDESTDRGSGQFKVQASWLKREPSSQGSGPASARAFMFFAQVRYNLP
jgi:hypothetical protein